MNKYLPLACLVSLSIVNCTFAQDPTVGVADTSSIEKKTLGNGRLRFSTGVRTIFQSRDGDYWLGSHSEGLCRHNGKDFEYFGIEHGLASNQIISIQEGREGDIWIGTLHGVSRFTGENFELVEQSSNGFAQFRLPGTGQNEWQMREADLWFNAGTRQGVYRYDGQRLQFLSFPDTMLPVSGNTYCVTGFSKGKNDMLWIGTHAGVFGFDGDNFTTINDETLGFARSDARIHVRSILEDSKGRLWIGNNGIGVLLKQGKSISNFSRKHGKLIPTEEFQANTLARRFTANVGLQSVFAIAEDSQGNIWFGDRDTGAWRYDGASLVNYSIDTELESQMIWDIYEDRDQCLLFAMASGGVYEFNGKSFEKRF